MSDETIPQALMQVLRPTDPRRVIGRGHPVGDILEAHEWEVLERGLGRLRVAAHLPDAVRNPRGQLFGGFTGTYVDFMSLFTFWAGREHERGEKRRWLATLNMRVDYFRPVVGPRFEMEGRVVHLRGGTGMVETRFYTPSAASTQGADPGEAAAGFDPDRGWGPEGTPLVFGYTTLKVTG